MKWEITSEVPRKFVDENYYLRAERDCPEGKLVLEVSWAQIMYALTVDLVKSDGTNDLIYDFMVFCEDRIEKYGHQVMRITEDSPLSKLKRLDSFQQDGVLNHILSEKYNVTFKTSLPERECLTKQ